MTSPLSKSFPIRLPGPLAVATDVLVPSAVAGVAALAATARRARVFHPRGDAFSAAVVVDPAEHEAAGLGWGVPLLDEAGEHRAVVRLSRGAGLPSPLPDVLGLALRLIELGGPSAHQDLLVNTAGTDPLLRRFFLPALESRGPRHYSSVLPYAAGGGHVLLGASPTDAGFALEIARGVTGGWQQWGDLYLLEQRSDETSRDLRFDPITNTAGGLEPVGFLNALRRPAYTGSQAAREKR